MTKPVATVASPVNAGPQKILPVTVIGGYLGAGKTTFINHLLRHAGELRLAVLVNDFGEIAIDADLIESADDQVLQLAGGCVCCSIGSDLVAALGELAERFDGIDHVLIETSGVALPGVVAATVGLAAGVERNGVLVLADALNAIRGLDDTYVGDTLARQFAAASLILMTKSDLADPALCEQLRARLAMIAPGVPIVIADRGLPVTVALGSGNLSSDAFVSNPRSARAPKSIAQKTSARFSRRGQTVLSEPALDATAYFDSTTWQSTQAIDLTALAALLKAPSSRIVRAKGILMDTTGQAQLVQSVGMSTRITPFGKAQVPASGHLLVITLRDAAPPAALFQGLKLLGLDPLSNLSGNAG